MLKLDLQRFAGEEDAGGEGDSFDLGAIFGPSDGPELDEYGDPIQSEGQQTGQEEPPAQEPPAQEEPPAQQEPQGDPQANEPPDSGQQQQEPQKPPVQDPETNARFAQQRREQEFQQRLQAELQQRVQQSPEYQLAQFLSQQSGLPVDQVLTQLREQALQQEAQQRGVPVEVLKQIQEANNRQTQLEQEINQLRFQAWQNRVNTEETTLRQKYDFLSDEDWSQAKMHMLQGLRNPDLPLEQAVLSLYGTTLLDKQREAIRQEVLAEMGGRKANPLAPQGAKPQNNEVVLTEDEKQIAKAFGMKETDYAKWKSTQ